VNNGTTLGDQPPARAGIFLQNAVPLFIFPPIGVSAKSLLEPTEVPPGWPAVSLSGNRVYSDLAPALFLAGVGHMLITGNLFATRGISFLRHSQDPNVRGLGNTVEVVNYGAGTPSSLKGSLLVGTKWIVLALVALHKSVAVGQVLFSQNQCELQCVDLKKRGYSSISVHCTGDLSLTNNQSRVEADWNHEDLLLVNAAAFASYNRVEANGLVESGNVARISRTAPRAIRR